MKHKFAIFIGRFSPFHLGHLDVIKQALSKAEQLIILTGSHNRARNIKNPWSSEERATMILSALSTEEKKCTKIIAIKDYLYNDQMWILNIQNKIAEATNYSNDIALIGFESDESSYYLKLFPKWKFYSCPTKYNFHATEIRDKLFSEGQVPEGFVADEVKSYLVGWLKTLQYSQLKEEFEFVKKYKEAWKVAPFPPTFLTCDCCVLRSGHILLVRRKGNPGKGLLALPGGFVNQDEKIQDAAIRELKEETAIKLSKDELYNKIVNSKVFDFPSRSLRGRTVSHTYFIDLGSGDLPKVKGSDDADKAFWLPLNEVFQREEEFFEDHFYMIQHFCMGGSYT